ncbi:uncharacterized protein N7459_006180 [Penicillium hispanicum]|uniref:uncharacterized protein n=1 Tax=Penicillium hispanicum TaxID=1080232 RepID=UPI002540F968|nr:uncharacterized protein N7459_006180 [Penicillium hispanicum]KAJ5580195.1 hypothetical protein N7459_006180 [Penicillium hispanicum]
MLILVAPPLFAASIYMTLGRVVIKLGAERKSIVPVRFLTKIFVVGDVISFLLQCGGGGYMAAGTLSAMDVGSNIVVGGLAVQLLFFGFFVIVSAVFHWRVKKHPQAIHDTQNTPSQGAASYPTWESIMWALYAACVLILCDEGRPTCGACSVRGDDCIFPRPQETQARAQRRPLPRREATSQDGNISEATPDVHAISIRPLDFDVPHTATPPTEEESRNNLNMHDLTLLQHYILHTSKKMSLHPRKILVWERVLPDIAANNPFLMHLLLALAGLDMLTTHTTDRHRSTTARAYGPYSNDSINPNPTASNAVKLQALVEHHQRGLQGLQENIATASESNAEVLLAASMLVVAFAFASHGVRDLDTLCQNPQPRFSTMDSIPAGSRPQIHWLRLVRGVTSIAQQSWSTLRLGRLRPLLVYGNANDDWKVLEPEAVSTTAPPWNTSSERLMAFALGAPQAIARLTEFLNVLKTVTLGHGLGPSPQSESSPGVHETMQQDQLFAAQDQSITVVRDMYMRTIYVLHLQRIDPCSSDRDTQAEMEDAAISSWPHFLPETFISSLDSDERLEVSSGFSFTILAHLYLLLVLLDDIWYFGEHFEMEIKKTNSLVAELGNRELSELMAWPMSIVGPKAR